MKKSRLLLLVTVICLIALILPMAVSAEEAVRPNGWVDNKDGSWSFWRDGAWVTEEVIKLGNTYYAFDEEGYMITDELVYSWCQDLGNGYFYAEKDGTLRKNAWYHDAMEDIWYYFGPNAIGPDDFQKIGKTWYYFIGGYMVTDEAVYSPAYNGWFALNKAGNDSKRLAKGWTAAFGEWYYIDSEGELVYDEIIEYNGNRFYFDYAGQMAANERFYFEDSYYLAKADGALLENGWAQVNGNWYYAEDSYLYENGTYEIGGNLYIFEDHKMYNIPGEYDYDQRYISGNGSLYRNKWRNDTIGYTSEIGWVYYGSNGYKVTGLQEIGGVTYYFNYNGVMQTNCIQSAGGQLWKFDGNGKGTVIPNGWFQDETKQWMYNDGGYLLEDQIRTIGGKTYAFDYNGYMVTDDYWDGYLFDKDGNQITTPGWQKVGGSYFLVQSDGTLFEGWKQSGKNWYLLWPAMAANDIFEDPFSPGNYYSADNQGVTTLLTGNGWRDLGWTRVYIENGKPAVGWKKLSGSWYYFDEDYGMLANTSWIIGENTFVFDLDGKMFANGWAKAQGETYYVDANGVAVDGGLHTIGGKQYLFYSDGTVRSNSGVGYYDGEYYWFNGDGSVRATLKDGWNEIDKKWYYFEDGELLRNDILWLGDVCYGFGSDYAMCTNGVKYAYGDYYIFDANGHILTGWQKVDGKWYYACPDNDPQIYENGIYYIGGKNYAFDNGVMQTGSFFMDGTLVTTDANGVITKTTELKDGWNYIGEGYVYLKNGEAFTGWVGNYFIDDGWMLFNERLEYNGKYYWLGADGQYVRGKWITLPGEYKEYMYADANGILACSQWKLIGGKYYYFYNTRMVYDDIRYIDGAYHEFDENGVWLGESDDGTIELPARGDGWQAIGGKWYYYHAGKPVEGEQYIGGNWYCFDFDGAMITNAFGGYYSMEGAYYTASGARAKYVGWKQIDGYWCYFDADHTARYGWLKSGNGWYFLDYTYDEDTEKSYYAMVKNTGIIDNGVLYLFNASGYCAGATTKDGWYQAGSNWYYVSNGRAVEDDYVQIGKDMYYFDWDGIMVTNAIGEGRSINSYGFCYYGADGKAVKTAGWKQTKEGWVYVGADGMLYEDGIYRIGGTDYSFYDCYWVK